MGQEKNLRIGQIWRDVDPRTWRARCAHGKRLTEDCIHCLDAEQQAAEDGEGWPVGTLRDGIRALRGGGL
jgi:hypothetical protein